MVANAERYYRAMYYGSAASWNLRDSHMFDTLLLLLGFYGPDSRGIVWEHNSHIGDARATEMSERGELNVGELCRRKFGDRAYIVGFGTDHGTVAAASNWDETMRRMRVRPSREESYERLFTSRGFPREPFARSEAQRFATSSFHRGSSAPSLSSIGPIARTGEPLLLRQSSCAVRRACVVRRVAGGGTARGA